MFKEMKDEYGPNWMKDPPANATKIALQGFDELVVPTIAPARRLYCNHRNETNEVMVFQFFDVGIFAQVPNPHWPGNMMQRLPAPFLLGRAIWRPTVDGGCPEFNQINANYGDATFYTSGGGASIQEQNGFHLFESTDQIDQGFDTVVFPGKRFAIEVQWGNGTAGSDLPPGGVQIFILARAYGFSVPIVGIHP